MQAIAFGDPKQIDRALPVAATSASTPTVIDGRIVSGSMGGPFSRAMQEQHG